MCLGASKEEEIYVSQGGYNYSAVNSHENS